MSARRVTPSGVMVMTAKEMIEDRAAWLRLRRFRDGVGWCIGSSDLPSILGVKGAATPVKVWHEKVNGIEQPDNPNMMWGRLHEDTIARYWRDRNRSAVRSIGLVAAVDLPWAQASLDRAVLTCPLSGSSGVCALEIKTRGAFGSRRFHKDLPDDILAQVCWQLLVSGYDHIHYAILVGGNDYRQGVVRAVEDALTVDFVRRKATEFRDAHLAGEFVPELDAAGEPTGALVWAGREIEPAWPIDEKASSLIELDAILHPERVGLKTIEELGDVMEFAELRARTNAIKKEYDKAKARLLRQAEGARWVTTATDNGSELVYEFAPRERTRVDLDKLKERHPDAYADHEVVTQTTSWQINIADEFKVRSLSGAPEE